MERTIQMTDPMKWFMAFFIFFSLVACSRITPENYDKIKLGMDYQQVVEILGEADRCDAALGAKSCIWGNDRKNIKIQFIAEKVVIPTMKGL